MIQSPPNSLNQERLERGITYLSEIDPALKQIVNKYGNPPMWSREQGFSTLIHIILEQQVSLASAKAAFIKLNDAAGELTPKRFLEFTDAELRSFGFSRQKAKYGRALSESILKGELNLEELEKDSDETVRKKLINIKGIGPWTANIYLLMALLRPDIWPPGDIALEKAAQKICNLPEKPNAEELSKRAEDWKPWRAVAARIIWHYYLESN